MCSIMSRRGFMLSAAALAAAGNAGAGEIPAEDLIRIRFLGTGAADWHGVNARGEHRRLSSVLVDGRTLIDFTSTAADMLPADAKPTVIFHTHSHGDHYQPAATLGIGSVRTVYVNSSWVAGAAAEYRAAAEKLGVACPEVKGIGFFETVEVGGIGFTSLPADHFTGRKGEHCSIYLLEKGSSRLLYATDTSGIATEAAVFAGIDTDNGKPRPLTGLVMEATVGAGDDDNFRLFTHSSVACVAQIVRVLEKTGCYRPRAGGKVYITHLARTLHGTQAEIAASLPPSMAPACDGLEVLF